QRNTMLALNKIVNDTNNKIGIKLKGLRGILLLSRRKVAKELSMNGQTIGNLEEGKTGGQTDKLSALIFFYGYTHKEFYDFDKPLPTEKQLRSRMKKFHEAIGS